MYLTVKDIAAELQVHERTVRNWIDRGLLKSTKVGNLRRISPEDYQEFLKNKEV